MRYSQILGKTVRDVPSDATLTSHKLLYKGGFIRRISTGRWAFTPLGMRVWEKVFNIIDGEMKAIGAQRLVVPTLHPIEVWKKTNRDQAFGEEMLVVDDHHGARFAIGATAEGVMLELVKMFKPSYKDLPINVYQFSQKFRDDKRPRGGIMRVREFMMKDGYSFCATEEQALEVYKLYYDAYLRIAKRLDLSVLPVLADSGAIGGSLSHEFQVESSLGDQTYFVCDKCDYGANVEKAEFERKPLNPDEKEKSLIIIDQPEWVQTMEDNVKHYKEPLWRYLKNVVYKDKDGKIYIASIRGDQSVNEVKLRKALGVLALEPATDLDLEKLGTKTGYVHSWGVEGATFIGDLGLLGVKNFIGGQKEEKTDSINVNYGRDFKYDLFADIVDAKTGDTCPKCKKGKLLLKTGFEWGHVFKIDHFYTKPQEGYFIDEDGKEKLLWMGSYGIGIERTIACLVETHNDEKGITWPKVVSPYDAHLILIDSQDGEARKRADSVYEKLSKAGVEVLYDDRADISAGVKFADCDLIGIPVRLLVSEKTGERVEWKEKKDEKATLKTLEDVIALLSASN